MEKLTKTEINKRYRIKNKEKIEARRKRIEIVCPDCNEIRLSRADIKRKTDRCNKCNVRFIREEQGEILHGLSKHPLFKRWVGMRHRCTDVDKRNSYLDKGIVVCDEWSNDFLAFYNWSNLNGFSPDLEIDRIDNDGNYSPENCRWITHRENCLNKG